MNDPIVDEIRRIRDAHAARFDYDLDAIFQDIKNQEKKSGQKFIAGVSRQTVPKQAILPTGVVIPVSEASELLAAVPPVEL